jgi:D-alanine-D-alanine ligase
MREICPGNFTAEEKKMMEEMSERAHKALGLSHYSHSDFIVHPKRGIYLLEVNSLPNLGSDSLIPKALEAAGASFPEFLDHVISLARQEK